MCYTREVMGLVRLVKSPECQTCIEPLSLARKKYLEERTRQMVVLKNCSWADGDLK